MPKKKPRNGNLTKDEKNDNYNISKVRIKVEHAIGHVKIFDSVRTICRSILRDKVILLSTGLSNFIIDSLDSKKFA